METHRLKKRMEKDYIVFQEVENLLFFSDKNLSNFIPIKNKNSNGEDLIGSTMSTTV
jgi:hypothetical protein